MSDDERQGYLIEYVPVGNSVKVSAVDPASGTEVSVVGPATASRADLARAAVRKLEYMLGRRDRSGRSRDGAPTPPAGRRGRSV